MIRLSRTASLLIATVASALLVAGPAYAADPPPPPKTAECEKLVAADQDVVDAKAAGKTGQDLTSVTDAAETKLCTGKASTVPSGGTGAANGESDPGTKGATAGQNGADQGNSATTGTGDTGTPSSQGSPPSSANRVSGGGAPKNRPGRPAGDRDCADFATQDEAQSYFESIGGSATNNADRLDANHNGVACESLDDDGDNQNASVTTTGDDESKADCKGDQVTEVPEGSAQTGGEQ